VILISKARPTLPTSTVLSLTTKAKQILTKQLQSCKPEIQQKITNPRNPPLWVLNPVLYTDPATWSRPPKYKIRLPPRVFPISVLNVLVVRHYKATHRVPLGIRGRYFPLLYLLLATLIAPPNNKCVLVVDVEGKFEVSKILEQTPVSMRPLPPEQQPKNMPREQRRRVGPPYHQPVLPSDLAHIYVIRPADEREGPLCRAIRQAKQYMMYGPHRSRDREFWGTVVIGADDPGADVDVVCGTMKCWLKVVREPVWTFGAKGLNSYKGVLKHRAKRDADRSFTPLTARCVWGRFKFDDRGLIFPRKTRQANVKMGGTKIHHRRRAPPRLRPAPPITTRSTLRSARIRRRAKEN
jgi:hypothetical protein